MATVDLTVETGTYWATQFTWEVDGERVPFTDPVMEMRQGLSPTDTRIARLDPTNMFDGKLVIPEPGVLQAIMTEEQTRKLKPGYGFWDCFVTLYGHKIRMLFGNVAIAGHVTNPEP